MSVLEENKAGPTAGEGRIFGLPEPRRLEGFIDAAFSTIITLLVLEIHRPSARQDDWERSSWWRGFLLAIRYCVHQCENYLA